MSAPGPRGAVEVAGWAVHLPGHASLGDWLAGCVSAEHESPSGELIPLRDRRRASLLCRALADVYAQATRRAGLAPGEVASVFGSALGEVSTMIALLDQMASEATPLSPMKFATSVHNAASGTISIATGNRGFTTSLGADYDTPAMALLEGIALVLTHGVPVVVCCGDEAAPEKLVAEGTGWSLFAAAIALRPVAGAGAGACAGEGWQLLDFGSEPGTLVPRAVDPALGRHPDLGLLDLLIVLEAGSPGVVRLDRGLGRGYSVRVARAGET